MPTPDDTPPLKRAALTEPLYYLENFRTVIDWVIRHHRDLLLNEEREQLEALLQLPESSQALLARMVMRKGDIFRLDGLSYDEIPSIETALQNLHTSGLVELNPHIDLNDLYQLCRRAELMEVLAALGAQPPKSARKPDLFALLEIHTGDCLPQAINDWWPDTEVQLVALRCAELMTRVRLMFFGNLHQDWSEFVLAELGHQVYERVEFIPSSRAFQHREELDQYLAVYHCYTLLGDETPIADILPYCPAPLSNPWLEHRRQRMLYQLAHGAERNGEQDIAALLYQQNPLDEAQVRYFRLQEKNSTDATSLLNELEQSSTALRRPESQLHLSRVAHRLRRKTGLASAMPKKYAIPTDKLTLANTGQRVELVVLNTLTEQQGLSGFYSENTLFTGLFALLFWPVLFEPLPGAFFHPFQSGPADLFRPDFVERRKTKICQHLLTLDNGEYQPLIKQCWREKYGTACTLIHWPSLSEELLELALAIIPAEQLKVVFNHLLSDLRHHRKGMPDLILFDQKKAAYQLVEVKGPGDRLQDHQRLWIEKMLEAGLPVSVAEITWDATP
jgi:hypothetical protein